MTTETKRRRIRASQKKRNECGHRDSVVKIGNNWLTPFSRTSPSAAHHRTVLLDSPGYKFEFHDWPEPLYGRVADIIGWLDHSHEVEDDQGLREQIKGLPDPEIAVWFAQRAAHALLEEMED